MRPFYIAFATYSPVKVVYKYFECEKVRFFRNNVLRHNKLCSIVCRRGFHEHLRFQLSMQRDNFALNLIQLYLKRFILNFKSQERVL